MKFSTSSLAALALVAIACARQDNVPADSAAPPVAGQYALADFSRLRWIEGRWRGFMPDGGTFYEEYRFRNDSTIVKYGFPDSTFAKASDSAHVQLRGGVVADESIRSRYVATRLDSTGIDFAPERGATNHFTWAMETPTMWNATLRWTGRDGKPQTIVYALHRFGR